MPAQLAILYEHPRWFNSLFAALRSRGIPFEPWRAESLVVDPCRQDWPALVFNRMSPSAAWRGHVCAQFAVGELLSLLESRRVPVVNGSAAYAVEISKLRQAALIQRCGLRTPATCAANSPEALVVAAGGLRFPVLVKPNCGGAGFGIRRFDSLAELRAAAGQVEFGADGIALVQEHHAPRDGFITRVEVLDGQILYAIRIEASRFNLCPADLCGEGPPPRVEPVKTGARVEDAVLGLARAARLDLGGIEFLADAATGEPVFYDINVLSNFVANAAQILGFDPHVRVADYLARRLQAIAWARA
jgi:glutathione synthase/RimK-type ligase-like ATP-grasp enzyme